MASLSAGALIALIFVSMLLRCEAAGDSAAFDRALPLLGRVLRDDTPEGLRGAVEAATAQLWTAWEGDDLRAACVTQSSGDTLHFWLCAGDGCDWPMLFDGIAAAARGRFTRCTIDGRRGWARLLGFRMNGDGLLERAI